MQRRGTEDPSGLGIFQNWGWSWPANRRVMYNRASCDPSGKPWDMERRQVWWNDAQQKWVGNDVPDFKVDSKPADHMGPFIMNPEGVGRIFAPLAAFADGPFPEHYEPVESPIANPLHPQQSNNPVAKKFKSDMDRLGTPAEGFNVVCTTYRLTEHYHYWTKNNPMNVQLVPEPFVEVPAQLGWGEPQVLALASGSMHSPGQDLEAAADVPAVGAVQQLVDAGVRRVAAAEHGLRLTGSVDRPRALERQDGQEVSVGLTQREVSARLGAPEGLVVHVEGHRHGPQRPVGQAHPLAHLGVVSAVHEAGQRREGSTCQQLEVAALSLGQDPVGPVRRPPFQLGRPLLTDQQVHQPAAMRRRQAPIRVHETPHHPSRAWPAPVPIVRRRRSGRLPLLTHRRRHRDAGGCPRSAAGPFGPWDSACEPAYGGGMDVQELLSQVTDRATVARVFGEPIEHGSVMLVPVARVGGGAGGGTGPTGEDSGGGGGGGFNAKPAGVYVVKDGRVTWQPALDVNRIVMGGQLVAIVVALTLRAIFKRH
jgi:uncharacterized spore protein YtfJ